MGSGCQQVLPDSSPVGGDGEHDVDAEQEAVGGDGKRLPGLFNAAQVHESEQHHKTD